MTWETYICDNSLYFIFLIVQLARNHARKIQDLEKKKKNLQKEKEEAFQDAFEDDIDFFKTYGRLDSKYIQVIVTFILREIIVNDIKINTFSFF